MPALWQRLQSTRPAWRWPIKWCLLALVVFLTLYPRPDLFARHINHFNRLNSLPDPADPALAPLRAKFVQHLQTRGLLHAPPEQLLDEVNAFVRRQIPYSWDWDNWGVADYIPTLPEVIARGTEDCDGRAVVAAALLRSLGVPANLVADTRHMWVRTPQGETMNPMGPPIIQTTEQGLQIRWAGLLDLGPPAFGVSVFPLSREFIILAAVWLLLLPRHVRWKPAMAALLLMIQGLLIVRLLGADPVRPHIPGIVVGCAIAIAAIAVMSLLAPKRLVPAEAAQIA